MAADVSLTRILLLGLSLLGSSLVAIQANGSGAQSYDDVQASIQRIGAYVSLDKEHNREQPTQG